MEHNFKFRKMRDSDRDELLVICSKIWEGNDFIPKRFDEWIADEIGEFTAIELDGKLIGCGKLGFVTPTDAWLQGLRKDVDLEVKGVGQALSQYYVDKLRDYPGLTSIRFATYYKNMGSVKANEKVGFRVFQKLTIRFLAATPEIVDESLTKRVETIHDSKPALEFIRKSGYFKAAKNYVNFGWIVHPYSDDLIIREFIEKDLCFGVKEKGKLVGLLLMHPEKSLRISFLDAESKEIAGELVEYVKLRALSHTEPGIAVYLPDYEPVFTWFNEFGFTGHEEDHDFLIYEYPLENYKRK